jgi:phosphatidylserine/phosphatidylglycerophosphate/cardiolipin synthase-like enzyme
MKGAHPLRQLLPPRFAWREGNQFELLVDGEQYFPHMLNAIAQAQHSIELEMYLASSGKVFTQFKQALLTAASRGVKVRLLFDDYGTQAVLGADRQALAVPGIELLYFNKLRWRQGVSNLLRDHRKLLLIDRQLAYVGGTGLTDEFLDGATQAHWHEVMLAIRGPVLDDWRMLFDRSWFGLRKSWLKPQRVSATHAAGRQLGRVCASNGLRAHHVAQSLYQQLAQCRRHVFLVTPYFLPSLKLRRLLISAAQRQVNVCILVPGQNTDHPAIRYASRRHYARLLRNGVRIFEYQPRFLHAKIAMCDDWVSIGSTNFDRWNLLWNLDANQEIDDFACAQQVLTLLQANLHQSEELHYASWQQRPFYLRCLEWFNGKLDEWLTRLR